MAAAAQESCKRMFKTDLIVAITNFMGELSMQLLTEVMVEHQ